jgi:cation diffusion facilitator family transporter
MFRSALVWLGFAPDPGSSNADHGHRHDGGGHGHTHGVIDPTIATTARGIWAIKWSFVVLAITAALQLLVVVFSGSVALLADTIHNVGDAATAIPLWIAFALARRKPSARFTYGLGRVEDLAGVAIVAIILFSALVAGYQAITRLIHPQPIALLGWVAVAGLIGFVGNEAVAVYRIRVGREINSAALIADGYHARTDGFTSLAVVLGATGVWLGFPLADPIVGLLITAAIFGIVWQSARAVFTRMLDGVEPEVLDDIRHAAAHVAGVLGIYNVRARWLGHRLCAELNVAVDSSMSVREAELLSDAVERSLFDHMPALSLAQLRIRTLEAASRDEVTERALQKHLPSPEIDAHSHAPAPVRLRGALAEGLLEIIDTPAGERLRFRYERLAEGVQAWVQIARPGTDTETIALSVGGPSSIISEVAPAEPHEFDALLSLRVGDHQEALPFRMVEPAHHRH